MSQTPEWAIPYVPENTLDPAAGLNLALERVDKAITESIQEHVGEADPHGQYEMRRQNNLSATADPTATDDETAGYEPLSKWINTTTDEVWTCIDATAGAAVWALLTLDTSDLGTASLADVGDFDPSGAAAAAQAFAVQRANHTGEQPISSVTGLQTALNDLDTITIYGAYRA